MTPVQALDTATGKGVRVAIVDTGVDASHPWVGGCVSESYCVERDPEGSRTVSACNHLDVVGHGTAAAGQIRRFAPQAELVSVRILDGNRACSSDDLVAALEWLVGRDVHVVNMSLSTMRADKALAICHEIDDINASGTACVCARGYHQFGRDYPTTFSSTIGITYAELPQGVIQRRRSELVELQASGVKVEAAWVGGTRKVTGSSYACPAVCGLMARLLSTGLVRDATELKPLLFEIADRQADGWKSQWMVDVDSPPTPSACANGPRDRSTESAQTNTVSSHPSKTIA